MLKASNSYLWALVVALYFLEYGVWQLATDEFGAGVIFTVMALVWVALARVQYRKTRAKKPKMNPADRRSDR
ncbi:MULTISPECIES: hypothetical protein [Paeniglutamicibacter]|jgi:uncharacterized membrane protein|uniref:Membrane protein n=1 Tax=Paeniglutamicibacter sulfureus TaxID=43666 RepID=A0ABU2BJ90_9MICC|nr:MULTISPECIES: hypothetical protein [Paeniglutamicibacter]MCV9996050.1 hypothetical protein [Paeniglutamicibacter sp. ZC-3]MDR7358668.1 putative membrane protein [Paeniglutamicibacter sulfureus]